MGYYDRQGTFIRDNASINKNSFVHVECLQIFQSIYVHISFSFLNMYPSRISDLSVVSKYECKRHLGSLLHDVFHMEVAQGYLPLRDGEQLHGTPAMGSIGLQRCPGTFRHILAL